MQQGVLWDALGKEFVTDRVWVALSGAGLAWTLLPELQTPLTLPAFQFRCPWLVLTSAFFMLVLREQDPLSGHKYEYLSIQCPHTSLWLSP